MDTNIILLDIIYHEMGIVPMSGAGVDINTVVEGLSTAGARTMKRKFRKAWRKAVKHPPNKKAAFYYQTYAEKGSMNPSRHVKSFRKSLVQMTAIRALMKIRESIDKGE